jgi:hypothetical protein
MFFKQKAEQPQWCCQCEAPAGADELCADCIRDIRGRYRAVLGSGSGSAYCTGEPAIAEGTGRPG